MFWLVAFDLLHLDLVGGGLGCVALMLVVGLICFTCFVVVYVVLDF